MIDPYLTARLLHVLGATILFGTGIGIAFFMFVANRTGSVALIAGVARIVVLADFVFTATAVIAQPVTGLWLVWLTGEDLTEGWVLLSLALYVFTGAFWLPVVWIQIQLRDMATRSAQDGTSLPPRYYRLMRLWFWSGWPAFSAVLAIFYLMAAQPHISL